MLSQKKHDIFSPTSVMDNLGNIQLSIKELLSCPMEQLKYNKIYIFQNISISDIYEWLQVRVLIYKNWFVFVIWYIFY